MRRILHTLILAALAATTAPSAQAWIAQKTSVTPFTQVTMASGSGGSTLDRYYPLTFSAAPAQAAYQPLTPFSAPGTISNLLAYSTSALTGVQVYIVTLYKNGVAQALTCTLNSSNQSCADTNPAHAVSFAAGDSGAWLYHPTGSPGVLTISASSVFTPTTPGDTIQSAWGTGFPTGSAQNVSISGIVVGSGTLSSSFPDGGTISGINVISNDPTNASSSYAYATKLNNVAQTLACTIAAGTTACSDPAHPITVTGASGSTIGSNISVQATPSTTPVAAIAGFGWNYRATTANSFGIIGSQTGTPDSASLTHYYMVGGGPAMGSATEAGQQQLFNPMTITKMAVKLDGPPGTSSSGKQKTFTIRASGVDTAASCVIFETQVGCTWTGTLTVANTDKLSVSNVPLNTPNGSLHPSISVLATR